MPRQARQMHNDARMLLQLRGRAAGCHHQRVVGILRRLLAGGQHRRDETRMEILLFIDQRKGEARRVHEVQEASMKSLWVSPPHVLHLPVAKDAVPRVLYLLVACRDDFAQDLGQDLRSEDDLAVLVVVLFQLQHHPPGVEKLQGGEAALLLPQAHTGRQAEPFVPRDGEDVEAARLDLLAKDAVALGDRLVHEIEPASGFLDVAEQGVHSKAGLGAHMVVPAHVGTVQLADVAELAIAELCMAAIRLGRHEDQGRLRVRVEDVLCVVVNGGALDPRVPEHQEDRSRLEEELMRRGIHRLASKVVEEQFHLFLGAFVHEHAGHVDAIRHRKILGKDVGHQLLDGGRLARAAGTADEDLRDGHVDGTTSSLALVQELEHLLGGLRPELHGHAHGLEVPLQRDATQDVQDRRRARKGEGNREGPLPFLQRGERTAKGKG
eukprot:scaffold1277_cov253-Pinguiococcus_pyrenoidosus.AAC.39